MAYIYDDCEECGETTGIRVTPSRYVEACSMQELGELGNLLIDEGFITKGDILSDGKTNINDTAFAGALVKLSNNRLLLSVEEENYILELSKRFV